MTIELQADNLDLTPILRRGDCVFVGQGTAEPLVLTEALVRQRAAIGGVSVFVGPVFSDTWQSQHADFIRFASYGALGGAGRLSKAGVLDVVANYTAFRDLLVRTERQGAS